MLVLCKLGWDLHPNSYKWPLQVPTVFQILEAETIREKNIEKAQKEAKVRARKEGAKSIYSQDAREIGVPDDLQVSAVNIGTSNIIMCRHTVGKIGWFHTTNSLALLVCTCPSPYIVLCMWKITTAVHCNVEFEASFYDLLMQFS